MPVNRKRSSFSKKMPDEKKSRASVESEDGDPTAASSVGVDNTEILLAIKSLSEEIAA